MKKVVLIMGVSLGMGKFIVEILYVKGYSVYGVVRCIEEMDDLKIKGMKIVVFDLIDDRFIVNVVNIIFEKEGRIDILINNVGYGFYGLVEDVLFEEVRR